MANKKVKIKYKNLFTLILGVTIVIAVSIVVANSFTSNSSEKDKLDALQTTPPVTTESDTLQFTDDPKLQSSYLFDCVKLTKADVHKGNLVLVNNNIAYQGDVSKDDLIVIFGNKSSSYMVKDNEVDINPILLNALDEMFDDFYLETENNYVMIKAGHRTVEYQQNLYDKELEKTGLEESTLVAKPGHSEHHTALAVDFTTYENKVFEDFDGTGVYSWIMENCYKYGIVNRYPESKTKLTMIDHEPWHFRYVGEPHAEIMYEYDYCLEEYISYLKNYTIDKGFMLFDSENGHRYIIYYVPLLSTETTSVYFPLNPETESPYPYEISGNNVDGFIVTVTLS